MEAVTAVKKLVEGKTVVEVSLNGEVVATMGGARANNAAAILVMNLSKGYTYGCRGTVAAAESEARRWSTGTFQIRGARPGKFYGAVESFYVVVEDVRDEKGGN